LSHTRFFSISAELFARGSRHGLQHRKASRNDLVGRLQINKPLVP
jgi:hypothetical protein